MQDETEDASSLVKQQGLPTPVLQRRLPYGEGRLHEQHGRRNEVAQRNFELPRKKRRFPLSPAAQNAQGPPTPFAPETRTKLPVALARKRGESCLYFAAKNEIPTLSFFDEEPGLPTPCGSSKRRVDGWYPLAAETLDFERVGRVTTFEEHK